MAKRMKKPIITALIVVVVLLALLTAEFLRGPRSIFAGFDRQEQRGYERIATRTTKDEVIQILGEPIETQGTFCLPQRLGFEDLFEAAERSNAVEYLLWINGMNWYYCIGFDSSGRVAIKGEGHS